MDFPCSAGVRFYEYFDLYNIFRAEKRLTWLVRLVICLAKVFLDALVASAVLTPAATASMYFLDAWKQDGKINIMISSNC